MTFLERAFVRRGRPRHAIVAVVGAIWGLYFLWIHNWIWALAAVLLSAIVARIPTRGMREENLAETTLGKIMLLHMHPMNLMVQIAGIGLLIYSIWTHSAILIMAGVSIILFCHLWGWHKVNDAL